MWARAACIGLLLCPASATPSDRTSWAPIVVPSSDSGAIVGLVLDPDSKPAAGARVTASVTPRTGYMGLFADLESDAPVSATSDATGHFRIALPRSSPRALHLRSKQGLIGYVPACGPGESVTVRLARPAEITLRVVDAATEAPLAGVDVAAQIVAASVLAQFERVPRRIAGGLTALDGTVRLTDLPPMIADIAYEPCTAGLVFARPWRVLAGETSTLTLKVSDPLCSVRGRVTNRVGNPIAGARVSPSVRFERSVPADDDGRFAIAALAASEGLTLFARAENYALGSITRAHPLARELEATIELLPGRRVHGRVVDAAGLGLRGAQIAFVHRSNAPRDVASTQDLVFARTEEGGAFVVNGLRADVRHVLLVRCARQALYVRTLPESELGTPELDLGTVVLEAPRSVAGTFVDADQVPIVGGTVSLTLSPTSDQAVARTQFVEPGEMPMGSARTDSAGRFRFEDLPSGAVTLTGVSQGGTQREVVRLASAGQRDDVVIRVSAVRPKPDPGHSEIGGRVAGRVLDPLGAPAARVALTLYTADPFSGPVRTTFTDDAGGFDLDDLSAAQYRAVFEWRDGFADAAPLRARRFLSVDELARMAQAAPDSDARTLSLRRVVRVHGRVVDPLDSRPRSWLLNVTSTAHADATACVASQDDGRYEFWMEEGASMVLLVTPLARDPAEPHSALDVSEARRFLVRDVAAGNDEMLVTVPH